MRTEVVRLSNVIERQCWHIYDDTKFIGTVCDKSEEAAQHYADTIVPNATLYPQLRMYDDDEREIASLTAWIDRRLLVAEIFTIRYFADMWRKSFGTVDNMPDELRARIDVRLSEL